MQDIVFFISENLILSSIWFFLLIIVILLIVKNFFLNFKFINNIQAIKLINKNNAIVIDTRSSKIFEKGHIVHSINIPLQKVSLKNINEIDLDKSFPIILIFHEVNEYNKYIREFIKSGFNDIFVLKNGIYNWNLDYLPLVTKEK
ncbi:rhodanese-like domain-containing protein [Buchnera aphidicola]|uniref:Yibn n=1 Tax=Buchnera aphidicola str. USDA (Myzus persicae) TaxID=1009856 RepID=W0P4C8_BUCMP|nr:rhodanese-like domain-containing protein [Buchnera aphidicola]AHG60312.1 Yibn [Buchnera aphidicola str. USDA (Myzus persicae)]AHG60890.1 Yibn [Buchnera aphidicola str. W106 (Myzus persicae)]AHG61462.1 Yibn [Buchnera aphidicola str. G002 (Myzus persicae)]AHG62035.1 Yibn [Buchnera aphidicola str. F009 (Myzus persicae)]WAI03002.1 MAG: rhodanese-like domain-containing protein [Buchnera aphidicola (Myzus persicae)]